MANLSFLSIVLIAVACALGAALGALFAQMRFRVREAGYGAERARWAAEAAQVSSLEGELREARAREGKAAAEQNELRVALGRVESAAEAQRSRIERMDTDASELRYRLTSAQEEQSQLREQLSEARMELGKEREQAERNIALLGAARGEFSNHFKALANEILEEKSKRFTEQNQASLQQLLDPLQTRLKEFQGKVEEVYVHEGRQRSELAGQVKQLMDLNQQLSRDATDLTRALKGSSKAQGDWGEVILEGILEAAGLRKGFEFHTQETYTREDGTGARLDAVLHLPEGKHIILDAKVSLVAYSDHVNCVDEKARESALERHIGSMRRHVKDLSERDYPGLGKLETMDFVIMFVPIEPAFLLAIGRDAELWTHAWERSVLMVTPSTLLFVLRTIRHLWRQEEQARNVREIASRGAKLYDELTAFAKEMAGVGKSLRQAQEGFEEALHKLAGKKGSVIRQAEMLRQLGVKPNKSMPSELLEMAATVEDGGGLVDLAAASENGNAAH